MEDILLPSLIDVQFRRSRYQIHSPRLPRASISILLTNSPEASFSRRLALNPLYTHSIGDITACLPHCQ